MNPILHQSRKTLCTIVASAMLLFTSVATRAQLSTTSVTVRDSSSTIGASTSATPVSLCASGSSSLSVTGGHLGTAADWKWYADACPTAAATAIGTGSSITVTPPANTGVTTVTHTYYVRAEGTCNNTACIPVTVTVYPNPVATAPANDTFCNNATVPAITLSGTPSEVTFDVSGGADIGLDNATGLTAIPSFAAINSGTAPVTRTISIIPKANGCSGTPVTFTLTVLPNAIINTIASQTKCDTSTTDEVIFSTTNTAGTVTYSWTNDHPEIGLAASGDGNGIPTFYALNATCADVVAIISVTPTFTVGTHSCTGAPVSFTYTVHPRPNGTIVGNGPICQGDPATITFDATCGTAPFNLIIENDGVNTNYDNQADGATITISSTPVTEGEHIYNLMKITDANGCSRGEE